MEIQKIKINELKEFVNSKKYLELENKPISLSRVGSYLSNPYVRENDIILYMMFENGLLVGYKTLLIDKFIIENENHRFVWLSGTWTHSNYRRKGISLLLFNKVYDDWCGKLMYTNYAEESKAVYDKSTKFNLHTSLNGYRHYIRFCFYELLPPKNNLFKKGKWFLSLLDKTLNIFFDLRFHLINATINQKQTVVKTEFLDDEMKIFLEQFKEDELFSRKAKDFEWIKNYPWIKTDTATKKLSMSYYFSSYADRYDSSWYKLYNLETKNLVGVVMITFKDGHLKMPYCYLKEDCADLLQDTIKQLCKEYKINYLTIYDDGLNNVLLKKKFFRIKSKKFMQNIFVTQKLLNQYPEIKMKNIQTGDGDVVFT